MKASDSTSSSHLFYEKWSKGEPFHVLLLGWLFFALTLIPTLYAAMYWTMLGAILTIAAPLCLPFGIFAAVKGRIESVVLALLTFVLCIVCSMSLGEYLYIALGDVVHDISASEARNYPKGGIFELSDARLDCRYEGAYASVSRDRQVLRRSSSCFVCPLVPEGWTPADPVPAWSLKDFSDDGEKITSSGFFAVIGPFERVNCNDAVKDALKVHGLKSFDAAPVLHRLDSLEIYQDYLGRARSAGIIMLVLAFGGWTLITAIVRAKSYKHSKSRNAAKTASKRAQSPLTTCPYCQVKVRMDRLKQHKKKCPERTGL